MKLFVFLLLPYLSLSEVGRDFNKCKQFFLSNSPPQFTPALSSSQHICQCLWDNNDKPIYLYATLYNTVWRIPIYSVYVLKSSNIGRCDAWFIEPQLDNTNAVPCMRAEGPQNTNGNNQAVNSDYVGSNYDKGHLYPVQHTNNHLSMLATSTLTNAAPQDLTFNRGQWSKHEKDVILDLQSCNESYVVTGVVPDTNIRIPTNNPRVTVSKYYWRATCCKQGSTFIGKGYFGPDNNGKVQSLSITDLQQKLIKDYHSNGIHEESDQEESEVSEFPESDISSCSGLDPDYKPPKSSSSGEDFSSPDKGAPNLSSEDEDEDLNEDKQQDGKCTINKEKNSQSYIKRHNKKLQINKRDKGKSAITIKTSTKREGFKRAWDKKHFCLYCSKAQFKISRHLERKHMDIKDVGYAFSFPLGSKERKVLLEQLRNKGDFRHNTDVLEKGSGQIITWKQPSVDASIKDYLPCPFCFGMFRKKDLWRHQSSCKTKQSCSKDRDDDQKNTRGRVQSRAACLLPIAASSDGCQKIINTMRQDDVSFHIRNDSLICKYGESLYGKHGCVRSRHQYIAQRMRELGRFMLVAKEMDNTVRGLEDLCAPARFQFVVNVAKRLTQFSPGKNEYGKPSTAVKIGFCLKGAVEVLIGQALMNDDDLSEKKAKKFFELLEKNWRNSASITAHQTIQEKRWNKEDDIPLTKNVIALRDHLRMVEDEARAKMTHQMNLQAYKALNETVLAQVIIFNKRREGEASRLTLDTYKKARANAINQDIYSTLSPLEKELSKILTRIKIRGKRGKKVPVFLTERMKESINLLVQRREEAGVPAENPYLFARPDTCSEGFSPQKAPERCSEDEGSDTADREQAKNRSSPKKRKRVAELFSPQKAPERCSEDEGSDIDREQAKNRSSPKKRKRVAELFSPQKAPERCSEDEGSDIDREQAKKSSPKKKKRKIHYRFSPQKAPERCSEDEGSDTAGREQAKKSSPKKRKRVAELFSPQKATERCREDQGSNTAVALW
ncbi:hypothetical protein ROHU_010526 [Labeo rohita]|uniref:Endonuclease domain-containing 1-like protein n=1 Tax=Labeo rohita TaxID=84645 RepID=A0A498LT25_LABRO|nr:hypothetical protein ROHU_010526 [Labeo rohita]